MAFKKLIMKNMSFQTFLKFEHRFQIWKYKNFIMNIQKKFYITKRTVFS
jgi:hypothetical protein